MTRTADAPIVARCTRLGFAIAGVDVWHVELDEEHRAAKSLDVLASLLAPSLGCTPESIEFRRDPWGKPQVLSHPNVHVNVSRSSSHLVAAIGSRPVGVDVEVVRPVIDR